MPKTGRHVQTSLEQRDSTLLMAMLEGLAPKQRPHHAVEVAAVVMSTPSCLDAVSRRGGLERLKSYVHSIAATARAAGLLTKVGSDLDAACGAVGAAVASDVRGEYTRSAPPFVRFHSHCGDKGAAHALTGRAPPLPAATARAAGLLAKVGRDLNAACGAVGVAVASDVRGEYTQSAPPFVRFHSTPW